MYTEEFLESKKNFLTHLNYSNIQFLIHCQECACVGVGDERKFLKESDAKDENGIESKRVQD